MRICQAARPFVSSLTSKTSATGLVGGAQAGDVALDDEGHRWNRSPYRRGDFHVGQVWTSVVRQ